MWNNQREGSATPAAAPRTLTPFRCGGCRAQLHTVKTAGGEFRCATCGWQASAGDGVVDFVLDPRKRGEAEYYDAEYAELRAAAPGHIPSLRQLWVDNPFAPHNEALLRRVADMQGKTVVVLGSGAAPRELYFLELNPTWLVLSDLSRAALQRLREAYVPDDEPRLICAAIDAEDLPFFDNSVDILYGYLFVHHLSDVDRFLREAARVLRPGGCAVFLDNGYAPLWESSKRTWLRWLMHVAHRVNPISPEDMRFTLAGGFRIDDLDRRIRAVGGIPSFERFGLLHYLAVRASEIFARSEPRLSLGARTWTLQSRDGAYRLRWQHRRALEALRRLDAALASRFELARRNQVRLVWGFDAPARKLP